MSDTPPMPTGRRTIWKKGFLALAASMQAARVGARLRRTGGAPRAQEAVRRELMRRFAGTFFGREAGIVAGLDYATFQARVPPRTYEEFAPWINRMKRGEADVLWPGRCAYFAASSGTTIGRTKFLPVTPEMLRHFRRAGLESLTYYVRRTRSTRVFGGRHLFLGGSTSLTRLIEAKAFPAWVGDLSGITAVNLPRWAERNLYEPGREIAQIADWPEKLRAIAARTAPRDVRLVGGIPSWILILAETMRQHTRRETLREIWPHLECLVHGGVPLAPYESELRAVLGPGVNFHEVYPASEGFIAAQDEEPAAGLRLLADAGIFYEFIPMEHFDESRLSELGPIARTLADVESGVDYAVLMTTPGGLCRYAIGDIVRFVSTQPPRLVYAGRTRLQLSAFGEHVLEKELTDALTTVCARRRLGIVNFHVAPCFVDAGAGRTRGRHEWWVELRSPGAACLDAAAAAAEIDVELQRVNDDYEAKRKGGGLSEPSVRFVPHGTFERWLRCRGKWGGQNKMPRCTSNRQIADDLGRFCTEPRGDAFQAAESHHPFELLADELGKESRV